MTTDSLDVLVNAYATACSAALAALEQEKPADYAAGPYRPRRVFDSGVGSVDPFKVSMDKAALAIFAADAAFAAGALKAIAEDGVTASQVVELCAAGRAILQFAAVAFRVIVASEILTDHSLASPARKLKDLGDLVDGVSISSHSWPLTASTHGTHSARSCPPLG